MSAAKNKKKGRLLRASLALTKHTWRLIYHGRNWLVACSLLAFCALAAYLLWNRIEDDVLANDDYQIAIEEISITPPPSWIRTDIRKEALRDGSLDPPLSILDDQLLDRLDKAFALHPWVAKVERVQKFYPARIEIKLQYRRPSAMVEVPNGLFPVDMHGILLPTGDFTSLEAGQYPRVVGIQSEPLGPPGTLWGDSTVVGAAMIAENCAAIWRELNLKSIRWVTIKGDSKTEPYFELVTKNGTAIPWGKAPTESATTEPMTAAKIERLRKYIAEHGNLDEAARRKDLDLRSANATSSSTGTPKAAR
ncbi:MAG: hypothetical protein SGJ20_19050 [Planctomycetota bacterium]|nr:hypothetical protein [Planctomycetota bacterium]